ncbi:hypothetical protein F4779DRAFT_109710 [Xylariaceae sp. FL0662B]|nr:hypothetical protein F4779DRAFT_109710 [Xylariaceae sp. FL0662B]
MCEVILSAALNSFSPQALVALKEAYHRLRAQCTTIEATGRAIMVTLSANRNLTNQERVADQSINHFWAYIMEIYHRLHDEAAPSRDLAEFEDGCASLLAEAVLDVTADANIYRLHLDAAHQLSAFLTEQKAYVAL